jgi:hypothetical protein
LVAQVFNLCPRGAGREPPRQRVAVIKLKLPF